MKKIFSFLCLSLLLLSVFAIGGNQKAFAGVRRCRVNGEYHIPNTNPQMSYLVKVQINGNIINGTLWTCDCGTQVIATDANCYCYPSQCSIKTSAGYPYLPGSYSYYVPSTTYSGLPSDWQGVH